MLRSSLFAAAIASSLLISGAARAQDEPPTEKPISGLEAGLQLGYGVPMGEAAQDARLSDTLTGKVPVIFDAGYRINANVFAGLYFQYAPAMLANDACPSGADCSSSVLRYGVEGQYRFRPRETWSPWVGLGLGLENVGTSVSSGNAEAEGNLTGTEFLHLTGGADYRVHDRVGVGPFVTLTIAQYSKSEIKAGGRTFGGAIDDTAIHEWLIVGVRARFHP